MWVRQDFARVASHQRPRPTDKHSAHFAVQGCGARWTPREFRHACMIESVLNALIGHYSCDFGLFAIKKRAAKFTCTSNRFYNAISKLRPLHWFYAMSYCCYDSTSILSCTENGFEILLHEIIDLSLGRRLFMYGKCISSSMPILPHASRLLSLYIRSLFSSGTRQSLGSGEDHCKGFSANRGGGRPCSETESLGYKKKKITELWRHLASAASCSSASHKSARSLPPVGVANVNAKQERKTLQHRQTYTLTTQRKWFAHRSWISISTHTHIQ